MLTLDVLDIHDATGGACMRRHGLCEAASCRYYLPAGGGCCALHVAERDLVDDRAEVGRLMGITRKRVEQLEHAGLAKFRREFVRRYGVEALNTWAEHCGASHASQHAHQDDAAKVRTGANDRTKEAV